MFSDLRAKEEEKSSHTMEQAKSLTLHFIGPLLKQNGARRAGLEQIDLAQKIHLQVIYIGGLKTMRGPELIRSSEETLWILAGETGEIMRGFVNKPLLQIENTLINCIS